MKLFLHPRWVFPTSSIDAYSLKCFCWSSWVIQWKASASRKHLRYLQNWNTDVGLSPIQLSGADTATTQSWGKGTNTGIPLPWGGLHCFPHWNSCICAGKLNRIGPLVLKESVFNKTILQSSLHGTTNFPVQFNSWNGSCFQRAKCRSVLQNFRELGSD